MTTETIPLEEAVEASTNGTAPHDVDDAPEPTVLPFDDTEKVSREGDPRSAVLDIIRKRLDRVLQPVDDDDVWHGVNVITRKDLNEALALPLPPASSRAAAVTTPAMIYVDALCPVCGIASEIALTIGTKLTAEGYSRRLELVKDSKALPHVCGQMRIRDVTPSRPVRGQTALDLGDEAEASDVPPLPMESLDPELAEAPDEEPEDVDHDAIHALAGVKAPADDLSDLDDLPF